MVSGTDIGCHHRFFYCAARIVLRYALSGTDIGYPYGFSPLVLRMRYALVGTAVWGTRKCVGSYSAGIVLRTRYALSGGGIPPMLLRIFYAMSGTDYPVPM
eukprot:3179065-Rhodomonas_salina.1